MSAYEQDYPDHTQSPDYQPGDEPRCNLSANETFHDVLESRLKRRDVLVGGLATAVGALFAGTALNTVARVATAQAASGGLVGFQSVPVSSADTVVVPKGYKVQVLAPWGTPISGAMPAFAPSNSGADQAQQMGMHHDGMHFFPIDGSATDGLLVMNHEYVEPRFLHSARYAGKELKSSEVLLENGKRADDEVLKEMNGHGISVVRVKRGTDGAWAVVSDPHNRRVTALTPMEISGPVRGTAHLVTKYSPDGTRTRGTLNNCAHGVTPWNTYLAAEENWAGYFRNGDQQDQKPNLPREQARYGVRAGGMSRYGWELAEGGADAYVRFDASSTGDSAAEDYRNEPNGFGWVVEIDPFDPGKAPVKRTHLGRFAHEGVVFAPAVAGKPVVAYAGDDARFEYIYKFVSARPYDPTTASGALLDAGTLYVARFNADGSGDWLALAPGQNGLTPENGFADLADILVNSRRTEDQVDPANPRAKSQYGHIIRWTEARGDHAATSFQWDIFVLGGDEQAGRGPNGQKLTADNIFACPDGLWFDSEARLWIQTDIGESAQNKGDMAVMGNNQMLCADPATGEMRRFLTGPIGQEITGITGTPDGRTIFVNVQHPGATTAPKDWAAGKLVSHWPDGGSAIPRSATLVIFREDGGVVGS